MPVRGEPSANPAFSPLMGSGVAAWSRPQRFRCFDALAALPLADSEILNVAHASPIAILLAGNGPRVVCLIHGAFLRASPLSAEGAWRPPYAPMALRCLPFRGDPAKPESMEFSPELGQAVADATFPLLDAEGRPAPEFAAVLAMLERLQRGGRRLVNAAKLLLAADLLVPLEPLPDRPGETCLVASRTRLQGLTPRRAAALTADANLPFELAAASVFSQRWLAKGVMQELAAPLPPADEGRRTGPAEPGVAETIDQPIMMDDSALFSFEAFQKSVRPDPAD